MIRRTRLVIAAGLALLPLGAFAATASPAAPSRRPGLLLVTPRATASSAERGLLANLTRMRVNAANALMTAGADESKSGVEEVRQQLALPVKTGRST